MTAGTLGLGTLIFAVAASGAIMMALKCSNIRA
jgi:hypothetical protein